MCCFIWYTYICTFISRRSVSCFAFTCSPTPSRGWSHTLLETYCGDLKRNCLATSSWCIALNSGTTLWWIFFFFDKSDEYFSNSETETESVRYTKLIYNQPCVPGGPGQWASSFWYIFLNIIVCGFRSEISLWLRAMIR